MGLLAYDKEGFFAWLVCSPNIKNVNRKVNVISKTKKVHVHVLLLSEPLNQLFY